MWEQGLDQSTAWERERRVAKSRRLWVIGVAGALVIAGAAMGVVALGASTTSPPAQDAGAGQISLGAADFRRVCPSGAPIPNRGYDLGREFEGLKRSSKGTVCDPGPPPGITVINGPKEAIGYVSVTYGSCTPTAAAGCFLPLEVQSWPQCARNPNSFRERGPGGRSWEVALNPSDAVRLPGAPWVPAQAFEAGARLEIYSGETTIVVYSRDRHLALVAATALAVAAHRAAPKSAPQLRSATHQPGDASSCTHRLAITSTNVPSGGEQ